MWKGEWCVEVTAVVRVLFVEGPGACTPPGPAQYLVDIQQHVQS